jgi:colanic acid/amylovoran biosynthesis glycosyltransferase
VTGSLAVFTTQLGTVSETFIRFHVEELAPERTVVVALLTVPPEQVRWKTSCPVLYLDQWASELPVRLAVRAGASRGGLRERAVRRFLRRHNVTVVLGEYLDQFLDFVPILDRAGIPYVAQGHGIDLSAALRRPGMAKRYRAYASAHAVLTRCEHHRRRLLELGLPAEKVHVNPGGIEIPAQIAPRAPGAGKRFLAIARMTAKKGPIYLLEAFRQAAAQDREITLDYIGEGALLPAVRQFVHAAGLGARVTLHGAPPQQTKLALLQSCGVFVQHSITDPDTGDEEGLPASIQEAMAHGMAVVSTRHSGIAEAVDEGVTGFLVSECDAQAMARAMLDAANDSVVARFGAAGAAKAAACYSWPGEQERLRRFLGLNSN